MKKIFISVLTLVILTFFASRAFAFHLEGNRLSFQLPQREIRFDAGRLGNASVSDGYPVTDMDAYFFGKNLVFRLLALVLPEPVASSLSDSITFTEEFAIQTDNLGSPDPFHSPEISAAIFFRWRF